MTRPRLSIRWAGGDLAAVLEGYGVDIGGGIVELASARIELERAGRPAGLPQLDVDELPSGAGPAAASSAAIDVAAVGWATVDVDRADANVAAGVGAASSPAARDGLLGATVRRSTGRRPEQLLLEPDTEGRLAGALARYGEGPAVVYLRVPDLEGIAARLTTGLTTRRGDGPLGPARLILGGPPAGPFLILVGPAPSGVDRVPSDP
jgi:hypothetical protein